MNEAARRARLLKTVGGYSSDRLPLRMHDKLRFILGGEAAHVFVGEVSHERNGSERDSGGASAADRGVPLVAGDLGVKGSQSYGGEDCFMPPLWSPAHRVVHMALFWPTVGGSFRATLAAVYGTGIASPIRHAMKPTTAETTIARAVVAIGASRHGTFLTSGLSRRRDESRARKRLGAGISFLPAP